MLKNLRLYTVTKPAVTATERIIEFPDKHWNMGCTSWHISVSPSLKQRLLVICTKGNRGITASSGLSWNLPLFFLCHNVFFFFFFYPFCHLFICCVILCTQPTPLFHFPFTVPHPPKRETTENSWKIKGNRTNLKPYDYLDKNKHSKW